MLRKPLMTLTFFPFGIVRTRDTDHGVEEALLDPEQVRQVLSDAGQVEWTTGLIQPDLLSVTQFGTRKLTVSFRSAQRTGIWLDGIDEPIRVPLPPLVLFKVSEANKPVEYRIFAAHNRPRTGDEPFYIPPLPNIYATGRVCWGSVPRPVSPPEASHSMDDDWNTLLGSGFNDHATGRKSIKFETDVRAALRYVEEQKLGRWPLDDLVATNPHGKPLTYNSVIKDLT